MSGFNILKHLIKSRLNFNLIDTIQWNITAINSQSLSFRVIPLSVANS